MLFISETMRVSIFNASGSVAPWSATSGVAPRFLIVLAAAISVASGKLERRGMRIIWMCICSSKLRAVGEVKIWSLPVKRPRFVPKRSGETGIFAPVGCAVGARLIAPPVEWALFADPLDTVLITTHRIDPSRITSNAKLANMRKGRNIPGFAVRGFFIISILLGGAPISRSNIASLLISAGLRRKQGVLLR